MSKASRAGEAVGPSVGIGVGQAAAGETAAVVTEAGALLRAGHLARGLHVVEAAAVSAEVAVVAEALCIGGRGRVSSSEGTSMTSVPTSYSYKEVNTKPSQNYNWFYSKLRKNLITKNTVN